MATLFLVTDSRKNNFYLPPLAKVMEEVLLQGMGSIALFLWGLALVLAQQLLVSGL